MQILLMLKKALFKMDLKNKGGNRKRTFKRAPHRTAPIYRSQGPYKNSKV